MDQTPMVRKSNLDDRIPDAYLNGHQDGYLGRPSANTGGPDAKAYGEGYRAGQKDANPLMRIVLR